VSVSSPQHGSASLGDFTKPLRESGFYARARCNGAKRPSQSVSSKQRKASGRLVAPSVSPNVNSQIRLLQATRYVRPLRLRAIPPAQTAGQICGNNSRGSRSSGVRAAELVCGTGSLAPRLCALGATALAFFPDTVLSRFLGSRIAS
jgi:hypothetical protein